MSRLGAAADMSASNVPGLPYQTYLAGAKVERLYPFGPLPGVAVMAAMVSHAGTCCFGLNIDGAAVADPETDAGLLWRGIGRDTGRGLSTSPAFGVRPGLPLPTTRGELADREQSLGQSDGVVGDRFCGWGFLGLPVGLAFDDEFAGR